MYEGDTPLAERRAQALTLDRALLAELLSAGDLRELLDADAISEVEDELRRSGRALSADDLHDLLRRTGDLDAGAATRPPRSCCANGAPSRYGSQAVAG